MKPPTYTHPPHRRDDDFECESLRLEAVTTCVGFDDLLDVTLKANHHHLDTMIVVTSHTDRKTHLVCRKHGAICVQTDLFGKNGRNFNKGAAINAGMSRWQYRGWRMHLDCDIALPDNFRRVLFNHSHLKKDYIYGCDRVDVHGKKEWEHIKYNHHQAHSGYFIESGSARSSSPRYVDALNGYVPIGYFQLWNAKCDKPYPWSQGTAAHDDVMFAMQWAGCHRALLPTVVTYHLVMQAPKCGENWDGQRNQPRFE